MTNGDSTAAIAPSVNSRQGARSPLRRARPIPAIPAAPGPGALPVESGLAKAGVYVTVVAGLCLIAAISNGNWNPIAVLGAVLFFSPVWLLALTGLLALHARLDRRPAGHRSARSGATRSAGPFGS